MKHLAGRRLSCLSDQQQKGNQIEKGEILMKTRMKSKRRTSVLLSILCAGLVATFLGGCAEGPYVAYDTAYIRQASIGHTRTVIRIRTITARLMILPSYAPAFAITTHTGRATTAATFTGTGINLRRAVG